MSGEKHGPRELDYSGEPLPVGQTRDPQRPWPKDEEGHDIDPADMTPGERAAWEAATA